MNYFIIPNIINDITTNDKLSLVYVYALISSQKKDDTFNCSISEKEITEKLFGKYNANKERSIRNYIAKLKTMNIFEVSKKQTLDKTHYYNVYHIKEYKSEFMAIDRKFILQNIPYKIKSFIIKLKAICIKGTNYYKCTGNTFNSSEVYSKLHISKNTFRTLLKEAIELHQISIIGNTLQILNTYILLNIGNNTLSRKSEIYSDIYYYCLYYGSIPPIRNKELLSKLASKYPLTDNEVYKEMKHIKETTNLENKKDKAKFSILKNSFFPYILKNKFKSLPKEVSYNYIATSFNIKLTDTKENEYNFKNIITLE